MELIEFLSTAPHEKTRMFELSLTEYVLDNNSKCLCETLEKILLDDRYDDRTAYNAFYCLNIIHRRSKDFIKLSQLFNEYSQRFARHITFLHLKVLFEIESGSMYDYDEVLNITYRDSELFSDNAGFVHLFADVFVTIYENGYIRDKQIYLQQWYDLALSAVNSAIELDNEYAKYYCTKARILCIKNEFMEALTYIDTAISIEKSGRSDYVLRICNYQYHKMMINVCRKIYETELNQDRLNFDTGISESNIDNTLPTGKVDKDVVLPLSTPSAYSGNNPYAFVSYSHMDFDEAMSFIASLQEKDIPAWFDEGVEIGVEYAEYIADKLCHASAFILLITPNSIKSEFVRKELQMAIDLKMHPICIYLKETTLTPGVMIQLITYQQIHKLEMNDEAFWGKIIPTVKKKLGIKQ